MTVTHPLPNHATNDSPLRDEELIHMYEGAMAHLAQARCSAPDEQKRYISIVVQILIDIKEKDIQRDPSNKDGTDLPTLYAYMIDRLSIAHCGLGMDPIDEVNWLLQNLKEISTGKKEPAPSQKAPAS